MKINKYGLYILAVAIMFSIVACDDKKSDSVVVEVKPVVNQDSIDRVALEEKYESKKPEIKYHHVVIRDGKHRLQIINDHRGNNDISKNRAFCLLNRKARYFIRVGDTVVVPSIYNKDLTVYSVFPQYYHGAKDIDKIVVVSNKYLCYGAYEKGKLVHFAACNTGKEKTPTYPGRYSFVWKKKEHLSSLDSTWVMPFNWNFHQYAGCAFHQFTMPGYAASHSCVRQFREDAKWMYYWAKGARLHNDRRGYIHLSGTPIIVLDVFDYRRPKTGPWVSLESNTAHLIELPDLPMEVEDAVMPISQIPVGSRSRLPNKHKYIHGEDTLRARGIIRRGVVLTETVNFNVLKRKKEAAEAKRIAEEEAQRILDETMVESDTNSTNLINENANGQLFDTTRVDRLK